MSSGAERDVKLKGKAVKGVTKNFRVGEGGEGLNSENISRELLIEFLNKLVDLLRALEQGTHFKIPVPDAIDEILNGCMPEGKAGDLLPEEGASLLRRNEEFE